MAKVPCTIIATTIGPLNVENGNTIVSLQRITHNSRYNKTPRSATAHSSPGCEYSFGIYPDSHECSTGYIKCAYGEPHPQQCEAGLAYDERIHGCNWPDQLLHICNPEGINYFPAALFPFTNKKNLLCAHHPILSFTFTLRYCSCCWIQVPG